MKLIIWDFRNTIYNPDTGEFESYAQEILEKLSKNYKMVLASSTPAREERLKLIKDLGIDKYFEKIYIGPKTAELFSSICKQFGAKKEEVFVIGDSYAGEIAIGNELGVRTIWFRHGEPDEDLLGIKYWKRIDQLYELDDILMHFNRKNNSQIQNFKYKINSK